MAENATQSAHITSSHGTGGKAGPLCESGAPCAALCPLGSDSDSTQKVDVFQEPVVESGVDDVPARPDATDLLFTRHELPSYSHLVPADCVQSVQPNWQNALSYKGDEVKQDLVKFAPAADLQALILSGDAPDAKPFHKDGLFQSSCSTGLVNSTDLESPGSPFEVLIGKNEFTNSSNNSIGHRSEGGTFDSEWPTKSWSSDTVAAGGFHTVPPLYERTAHQDWLVDSQDFQCLSSGQMSDWNTKGCNISGEPSPCPDLSNHSQSVGLNDLSPEVIPKMHLHQVAHAQPLYQSVSSQDEIDFRLSPQKSPSVAKEAEPFVRMYVQSAGLEHNVISLHTMESKSPGSKSYQSEGPPFSEHLLDSFELAADSNWPDTSEMAEADSSGESDDTVIEDTKACLALAVKKEAEMVEIPKAEDDLSFEGTDLAAPVTLVLVPEREINVEYSPDELTYHEKSKLPYAIPEEDVEFMDDFETLQAPATDFVEGEFKPQHAQFMELSKPEMQKLDKSDIKDSDRSRMFSSEILLKDVGLSVKESKPSGFSLDKTTATSEHPDSVCGERFINFMKEWSAENNERFQETLAQVKANVHPSEVYADATEVQTRISATLRKLPFSETGEEYCIFSEPGEVASTFSSHDGSTSGAKLQPSPATPEAEKFFLDLDQEKLTITALRELSTIPDESPVSAGESDSPSPKGNKLFQTASPPLESFVSGSEFLSNPRQTEASKEVLDVRPDFPSSNLLIQSSTPKVFHSVEGSSSTTELAKGQEFVRPLRCSARDLVFWRDVKKSGVVFGTSLVLLLSLAAFSVISVVAYLMLALLSVTISFRVYRSVIQAVQKKDEGHPFKPWLDVDISVSSEAFHNYMNTSLVYVNKALKKVIRLFLVEDLVDSLKLAVFMWLMTYVGAVFNGITLLILGLVLAFTFPIVYEKYQTQIDHYVAIIREQSKSIIAKVHAKLPGLAKKKAE
ncbi:reticulon-3 isoform X1 [Ambystoma mexicanum]|uniref:reticulon-3 isoform X1 n=1 Tax=Ambystoma mexicanum TaxID=8296 RepID=UPI0037E941BD